MIRGINPRGYRSLEFRSDGFFDRKKKTGDCLVLLCVVAPSTKICEIAIGGFLKKKRLQQNAGTRSGTF
ncbi:hypothetical protein BT63DRAFT_296330 [Microthyrium microscopicum]|uniref:Uncharacterized protein n=1 Tax=Microthyrium microscopicum TaxID=703497 RepID=A0A6A6U8I6_9PEZI|nr:hypothetical protein BT63DRAFT_296330 [Microthyrium microscopicum]